jgi:glutamate 5-kinase
VSETNEASAGEIIAQADRIVIKIGTGLIVNDDGFIRRDWMQSLFEDILNLKIAGVDVCLVISGAQLAGRARIFDLVEKKRLSDVEKRLCASIGHVALAEAFEEAATEFGIIPAMFMLDQPGLQRMGDELSLTVERCWELGVLPIFEQNDAMVDFETEFSDDDQIASQLAAHTDADLMLFLSTVDGVYRRYEMGEKPEGHIPWLSPDAALSFVNHSSDLVVPWGGMADKLISAFEAAKSGTPVVISDGRAARPVGRLLSSESRGTVIMGEDA